LFHFLGGAVRKAIFLILNVIAVCSNAVAADNPRKCSPGNEPCIVGARLSFELIMGDYPSGTDIPVAARSRWRGVVAGSQALGALPKKHFGNALINKPCKVALPLQKNDVPVTDLQGGFIIDIKVTDVGPGQTWAALLFVELDDSSGMTHVWGTGQGSNNAIVGHADAGYVVHTADAPNSPQPGRPDWKDIKTKDLKPWADCSQI
jgi:hypothetical protein